MKNQKTKTTRNVGEVPPSPKVRSPASMLNSELIKENKLASPKLSPEKQENLNGNLLVEASKGNKEEVERLLKAGADINSKDYREGTALMEAVYLSQIETVQILLDAGADVHVKNHHGETALMRAAWKGDNRSVQLLLDAGADINGVNAYGGTVLEYAMLQERTETIKLLKSRGAKRGNKDTVERSPKEGADTTAKTQSERNGGMVGLSCQDSTEGIRVICNLLNSMFSDS